MKSVADCVILGGHGFIGSALVKEAQTRGYTTRAIGRADYDQVVGISCGLLINANGNSRKYLARQNPLLDFQLSVESVYRSLIDIKPNQYIFCSSMDVYPNVSSPTENHENIVINVNVLSPYGLHKFMAEQLVHHHRPDAAILRLGGVVGPGLWKNPIFDLLTGTPLRVHPDSSYNYLDTRDFARMTFDLIESGLHGEILNVAGDGVISLKEIAEMIPDCLPRTAQEEVVLERYEMNIERLMDRCPVPSTRDTVWRFLRDVMNGRVSIGRPKEIE